MSKKKLTIAALVLALVLVIGGIVAYFTDVKDASNVFTLGNVSITLTEPSWVPANAENMSPGKKVDKDPTITNTGSMPAYVFAEVKVPMTTETTPREVFSYTLNDGWVEVGEGTTAGGFTTHVYAYGSATAMTSLAKDGVTPAVFDDVTLINVADPSVIPVDATSKKFNLDVKAKAIQANDLGTTAPAAVYALF